jgi:hypothetical protein
MTDDADKKAPRPARADDEPDDGEEAVEELAGLFGAGPKAVPAPKGPMPGEQYAP